MLKCSFVSKRYCLKHYTDFPSHVKSSLCLNKHGVTALKQGTVVNLGEDLRPWQWWLRDQNVGCFWAVADVFQLKYTGLKCGCVLCVLVTTIFYYLVTAVHSFGSMLVIKSTSSKWRLVEVIHAVTGTHVFDRAYMFFLQRYLGGMGPFPRCQGQSCSRQSKTVPGWKFCGYLREGDDRDICWYIE